MSKAKKNTEDVSAITENKPVSTEAKDDIFIDTVERKKIKHYPQNPY